ncbi:MAG: hypothetical protein ACK5E6_06600, partial [Cyanobacteriota bacterium]
YQILSDPDHLKDRYVLTPRERRQVLAVAGHPAMVCVCSLQRMNRLSPLALDLPGVIAALAPELTSLLPSYWADHPWAYSHGAVESERFCRWLRQRPLRPAVLQALNEEEAALRQALAAIQAPGPLA